MLESILQGLQTALTPLNLVLILSGTLLGIFVGAMPGLSASSGLAIALPFTFVLPPIPGMLTMVSLYMAAEYGGSISAITIGVPGTPAAFATTFDGFPMSQRGETAKALAFSVIASTIGGAIGTIFLVLAAGPIATLALRFGPAEYFALAVLGLSVIGNLAGESAIKSFVAVAFGLLFGVVGLDVITGHPRLTFDMVDLLEGVELVPALIGLFAISEVLRLVERSRAINSAYRGITGRLPTPGEIRALVPVMLRGSAIGATVGAVPGAGATIASLIAYSEARRVSKRPAAFGRGVAEGIAAPESANNASVGGAMIPLLTLGIPGSASTAVLLGGLMLHGIEPGPLLMRSQSDLVYAIYAGLLIADIALLAIGLLGIPVWVRLISLKASTLTPMILGISLVGTYSLGNSLFHVWMAVFFGVVGYGMRKFGFPVAPVLLGLVLGPILEANYRRALIISGGAHSIFLVKPLSLILLLLAVATFFMSTFRRISTAPTAEASRPAEDVKQNFRN